MAKKKQPDTAYLPQRETLPDVTVSLQRPNTGSRSFSFTSGGITVHHDPQHERTWGTSNKTGPFHVIDHGIKKGVDVRPMGEQTPQALSDLSENLGRSAHFHAAVNATRGFDDYGGASWLPKHL